MCHRDRCVLFLEVNHISIFGWEIPKYDVMAIYTWLTRGYISQDCTEIAQFLGRQNRESCVCGGQLRGSLGLPSHRLAVKQFTTVCEH